MATQTTAEDIVTLDNMIKRAYNDMKVTAYFSDYGSIAIHLIEARNILKQLILLQPPDVS